MKTADTEFSVDLLEAHGAWLRRLARSLVADEAQAEDLAQDTWVAAIRRPPRPGNVRAWLGRVLVNTGRNQRRGDARRVAREEVMGRADADSAAPSAEELQARTELQREVAALVAGLDEPLRQVVHLRYFEDLDSAEIGRRLGLAAGTVRWRLKTALDELRTRLDDRHGGRARWAALMSPLAGGGGQADGKRAGRSGETPPRTGMPWTLGAGRPWIAAVATLTLAVTLALGVHALRTHGKEPVPVQPPSASGGNSWSPGGGGQNSSPGWARSAAAGGAPVDCPETKVLREEIARREDAMASRADYGQVFARSAPNSEATKKFTALIEEASRRAGDKCSHTVDCRGVICRVQRLVPSGVNSESCVQFPEKTTLLAYLYWYAPSLITSGSPAYDAVTKQSFRRVDIHYRLASPSADPLPREKQAPPPPLLPGRYRTLSPPAKTSSAACRAEVVRLQQALVQTWHREEESRYRLADVFAASEPNHALVPEVTRELRRLFDVHDRPVPFAVECRGQTCSLAVTNADDPAAAMSWDCRKTGNQEICQPGRKQDGWFMRIEAASRKPGLIAATFPPAMLRPGTLTPAYLRVRPVADRRCVVDGLQAVYDRFPCPI